jgi:hypothetical protein
MATTQIGSFKAIGQVRKWGEDGKSTKFYVDLGKDTDYPQIAEFETFGDKVDLTPYKAGDEIEVHFNIKGAKREWEDKKTGEKRSGFFQNLQAWKIEKVGGGNSKAPKHDAEVGSDSQDLPF